MAADAAIAIALAAGLRRAAISSAIFAMPPSFLLSVASVSHSHFGLADAADTLIAITISLPTLAASSTFLH
jgi:hypothetical protein